MRTRAVLSYRESVQYMSSLLALGVKLGNDRFLTLLQRLGNPHLATRAVHVAGTNGKGSTTAMVAAVLREQGYRTGGYFSPYVFDVRERIQLNNEPIPKAEFARVVSAIRPVIEELAHTEFGWTTEFELKTAAAFLYFAEANADFAAIEVGMGGRLDATNVVSPLACVVTNIGLDHTEHLGPTHKKIAQEKAGIIKPEVPISTAAVGDALRAIEQIAESRGAPLTQVTEDDGNAVTDTVRWKRLGETDCVTVRSRRGEYHLRHDRLPGAYQSANVACAVSAIEHLRDQGVEIRDNAIERGIASAWLPGRLQQVADSPVVVLDGAHNSEAAFALADALARGPHAHRRRILVLGMATGHDPAGVIAALSPGCYRIFLTRSSSSRAQDPQLLLDEANRQGHQASVTSCVSVAVRAALSEASADDLILVTGSFFTIGDYPLSRDD